MRTDPTNCGLSLGDRDVAPQRGRPPIRFTGAALLLLLLLVLTPAVVGGASDPPAGNAEEPVLKVHPLWSVDRARGGDRIGMALVLQIASGYHINADADQLSTYPTFSPYPTRIQIPEISTGVVTESPQFPQAHTIEVAFAPEPLAVFDGRAIVYIPLVVPSDFRAQTLRIKIALSYQACDATACLLPETIELTAELPVATDGRVPQPQAADIFSGMLRADADPPEQLTLNLLGWRLALHASSVVGLGLLLLVAAVGGLLLNLTPCVLPLIPIKIISLSNAAQNRGRCLALGLSTFGGMLAFWLAMGLAIAGISGMTAINQLFQYPLFTILIGAIIAVMAIGMCRAFAVPLPQFLYRLNPDEGTLAGAFSLGTLAAILSTPCTAPFMGAAAAWAATQKPSITLSVFGAIGIGMALPYLVLAAFPALVQRMPRSGPAGVLIKQVMGLFMLAAAAYFIGAGLSALAVRPPDPPSKIYWWVVMGFIAAGGLWTAYRSWPLVASRMAKTVCLLAGLAVLSGSVFGGLRFTDKGPIDWIYYTEDRYQAALAEGRVVVMVFTAAWCLNCKALQQGVLQRQAVAAVLNQAHVAPIKVDITGNNPDGRDRLLATGQLTIPLLMVYAPDGRVILKRSFYTAAEVISAVDQAAAR
ncbi:MAG: cytochrome c biogenesis protein CcdA [Desulfobacterales bacterium]